MPSLASCLQRLPLIAILRGLRPEEAESIGSALVESGLAILEVPLNSPHPMHSIERLQRAFGERALVGAGTVLGTRAVGEVADAGGRLIVMPHGDPEIIRAAKERGLYCVPGVATPTEAFAALAAGADALKMFPAEALPPAVLRAWRAVLPEGTALIPVGSITPERIAPYKAAGAAGFGVGSPLFKPGDAAESVRGRALVFRAAVESA
jgi:2-dehydro-3-deoxyphosphogalactonate aldolase